jgi:hypothetical protein
MAPSQKTPSSKKRTAASKPARSAAPARKAVKRVAKKIVVHAKKAVRGPAKKPGATKATIRAETSSTAKRRNAASTSQMASQSSRKSAQSTWSRFTKKLFSLRNLWVLAFVLTSFGSVLVLDRMRDAGPARTRIVVQQTASDPPIAPKPSQFVAANAAQTPQEQAKTVAPPQDTSRLAPRFVEVRSRDLSSRIDYWSHYLLSNPGARNDLESIEGAPSIADSAPWLPQKFDCTTFVETVAALSRSESGRDFYKQLLSIRYKDAQASFARRNHFPEGDWIPNNERSGNLRDITLRVASDARVDHLFARKTIDRAGWIAKQLRTQGVSRALASVESAGAPETELLQASVAYIPLDRVEEMAKTIPHGAILNVVRHDKPGKPVLITHQGFVIQDGKSTLFRHASLGGEIKTVPLMRYLRDLEKKAREKNWPLAGINLNQLN